MDLTEKICFYLAKCVFLEGMGANNFSRLRLHFALPVYTLDVSMFSEDKKSSQTRLCSWQFLVSDAKGIAVAGEVPLEPDSNDGYATSLARGPAINDTWEAYRRIRQHPDVKKGSEIRRLRISSLQIDAFWLKARPAGGPLPDDRQLSDGDRVYSFTAFPNELKSQILPASDFVTQVWRFASDRHSKSEKMGYLRNQDYRTYQNIR
jgi:hypothetical protein